MGQCIVTVAVARNRVLTQRAVALGTAPVQLRVESVPGRVASQAASVRKLPSWTRAETETDREALRKILHGTVLGEIGTNAMQDRLRSPRVKICSIPQQ